VSFCFGESDEFPRHDERNRLVSSTVSFPLRRLSQLIRLKPLAMNHLME